MELETIYQNVIDGNAPAVQSGVKEALAEGADAGTILQEALIRAMTEIGRRFESGDLYVPEMLVAARAMQAGLIVLKPLLMASGVQATGRVAIGTVQGDLHDIGKNLVAMMLEGAGLEVNDLGADVAPERFVQAAQEGVDVIAMSALLTTTMPAMKRTMDALEKAGARNRVKVIVGGAPVTREYAKQIGADGYAPDASSATRLVKSVVG
ncbi:MAG: corrinoid protein [Chloroflexi bacterium]|nr:corrinoid protein [Chloroflexota bacterium]